MPPLEIDQAIPSFPVWRFNHSTSLTVNDILLKRLDYFINQDVSQTYC